MQLLGRATSVNVQKVLWTLEELGVAYDRKDMGGAHGGLDTASYAAMNPNRRVPTLIDGDLVVWESNAVVRYLANAYDGGSLAGATVADVARADMWMEWFQNNCYTQFIGLFYQTVRQPKFERDPKQRDRFSSALCKNYEMLESHLANQPYVAGDKLSMGDIVVGSSLYRFYTMEFDRPDFPALGAYYNRLGQREAYRNTVMTSYDSLRPTEG
jgi:glutathione S-transferase